MNSEKPIRPGIRDTTRVLNVDATIGQTLRRSRERQGVSLRGLSRLSRISKSALGRIESGERSLKVWELLPIARAYKINPIDILKATAA